MKNRGIENSGEQSDKANAIQKAVKPAGNYSLMSDIQKNIEDDDVTELSIKISKPKGIIKISGKKGDVAFNATRELYGAFGEVQSASRFDTENMRPADRAKTVKSLRQKGLTQQEIAATLGISQSLVSNILRQERNS